jgi:hypothetical protein
VLEAIKDTREPRTKTFALLCILQGIFRTGTLLNQHPTIDWLLSHGANLDMPCPSLESISYRPWKLHGPTLVTHAAPQSPMMGLVIELYQYGGCKVTVLRLIEPFLDHGASIDTDSAVFFVEDYNLQFLNPGWPTWDKKAPLIYKAKLSFLLHLALLSMDSAFSEDKAIEKLSPPRELTQSLLSRLGKGELPDYPEVFGCNLPTSQEDPGEFDICKVNGVEDSSPISSLLVKLLWDLARGTFSYDDQEQELWDELHNIDIKDGLDTIPVRDFRDDLVEAGYLVSLEDYWKEIVSFRVTK